MISVYELYQHPTKVVLGLLVVVLWELVWKGLALWHAAKEGKKRWFIALLIVNSFGILPILYLIWFREKKEEVISEAECKIDGEETKEKEQKVVVKKTAPRKKKVKSAEKEEKEE